MSAPPAHLRTTASIDRSMPPSDRLELVEDMSMFAPLSLATKERLARALDRVEVSAGEVVLREGDVGNHFYIVGAGRMAVLRGGVQVGTAAPPNV